MPITEDFIKHLMEQNAALLAQNAAMAERISQLTKTPKKFQSSSSDRFKKPPVNKERNLCRPSGKNKTVRMLPQYGR